MCDRSFFSLAPSKILTVLLAANLFFGTSGSQAQLSCDSSAAKYSACSLAGRLGIAVRMSQFENAPVRDQEGNKIGKVKDLVVDLSSGHISCVMIDAGKNGGLRVVPAEKFYSADEHGGVLQPQAGEHSTKPCGAPESDFASILNLLPKESAASYSQNMEARQALLVQTCKSSELMGKPVKNPNDESLGAVTDLIVDVPRGRLLFAIISFAGRATDLYAVPPTALRLNPGKTLLVLDAKKNKVAALAQNNSFFWSDLRDASTASGIYKTFGQKADFDKSPIVDANAVLEHGAAVAQPASLPNQEASWNDSQIQREILLAVMRDDMNSATALQKIKIACFNGRVTLTGHVKNEKLRSKLTSIVAEVIGAGNMTDQLDVK